jgi:hypothetical protein
MTGMKFFGLLQPLRAKRPVCCMWSKAWCDSGKTAMQIPGIVQRPAGDIHRENLRRNAKLQYTHPPPHHAGRFGRVVRRVAQDRRSAAVVAVGPEVSIPGSANN